MKNLLPLQLALLLLIFSACKEEPPEPIPFPNEPEVNYGFFLDSLVEKGITDDKIPGLAIGVVRNGEIDWEQGYGLANREEGIEVTKNTSFILNQGADLILTTIIQQAVDKGLIDLDENINRYIPFKIVNPIYPNAVVTMRMLLSHTAGLADNTALLSSMYVAGDSDADLKEFLTEYLLPGGANYSAANFTTSRPGKTYEYSRVGIALAGYILENATGIELDIYSKTHVFTRLGLSNVSWFLSDLRQERVAIPYVNDGGALVPQNNYGYPFYPSGQLRMNISQLLRVLIVLTQNGSYGTQRILKPSFVAEMKEVQYPRASAGQALAWRYVEINGRTLLGISGFDTGSSSRIYIDPATNVGVAILTNGRGYGSRLNEILVKAFEVAETEGE
ncbi:MAG: serine hydrolase [Bacteroidetes bacterium]|nr:serine hydrolase [Bacteroidota bacterium]